MQIHDPAKFGPYIQKLRKMAGISLQDMADRVGISKVLYGAIERAQMGSRIDDEILDEMAEHLPRFSLGTADGVHPPSTTLKKMKEDKE